MACGQQAFPCLNFIHGQQQRQSQEVRSVLRRNLDACCRRHRFRGREGWVLGSSYLSSQTPNLFDVWGRGEEEGGYFGYFSFQAFLGPFSKVGVVFSSIFLVFSFLFGCTCQYRLSSAAAVQQQCSSSEADEGWRFVPDAILPGHPSGSQQGHPQYTGA